MCTFRHMYITCVYIYMYICLHIFICMWINVHIYIYMYISTCVYISFLKGEQDKYGTPKMILDWCSKDKAVAKNVLKTAIRNGKVYWKESWGAWAYLFEGGFTETRGIRDESGWATKMETKQQDCPSDGVEPDDVNLREIFGERGLMGELTPEAGEKPAESTASTGQLEDEALGMLDDQWENGSSCSQGHHANTSHRGSHWQGHF